MEMDVFIMHLGLIDRNFHRKPQHILCIDFNEGAVFILSYILLPEQQWFGFGFLCFSVLVKLNGERKENQTSSMELSKKCCAFLAPSPIDSLPTQIVPQQKQKRNKRALAAQV